MKTIGLVLAGVLVGLLAAGLIWLASSPPRGEAITLQPPPTSSPLVVDVRGEVMHPGVYTLVVGSRVEDAVQAAGGFTLKADRTGINLAALLSDGQQISVTTLGTARVIGNPNLLPGATLAPGERVNINTADLTELETLPGIGPALGQRIIDYRDENGDFQTTEDIMQVSGIGQATFQELQDLITVGE
jgi:competence protein ComEA